MHVGVGSKFRIFFPGLNDSGRFWGAVTYVFSSKKFSICGTEYSHQAAFNQNQGQGWGGGCGGVAGQRGVRKGGSVRVISKSQLGW